jgi:Ser/Thr protein kinase RdoA (MazF antagonist)
MMQLSTMRALVDTLDDRWQSPIAEEIAGRWPYDPGTLFYWRASANFVFIFKQKERDYILRFNHASERTLAYIQAELDYLNHLAAHEVPVAKAIPSRAGKLVESVETSLGVFHAVVFDTLPGEHREFGELTPEMFVAWGRALGTLHLAAQSYQKAGRPTWQDHLSAIKELLSSEEKGARELLEGAERQLQALSVHPGNFGLIHFDFELDNLLWCEERLGIIDLDDAAWYWYAADIAFALRDLFGDNAAQVDLHHPSFLAFVQGYRQVREIPQEEVERIPLFLQLHNLRSFARVSQVVAEPAQDDDPAWLAELRQKLARKVKDYREGLSEDRLRLR